MRVLVTGMSGTGKSAVAAELRSQGYPAFDADDDGFTSPAAGGAWDWRTDAVGQLLADTGDSLVFFTGCSDEQAQFSWDLQVVLTVPDAVLVDRLATRSSNTHGRGAGELDRILADRRTFEPLLIAHADLVIDTRQPLSAVVASILDLVERAASTGKRIVRPQRHGWSGRGADEREASGDRSAGSAGASARSCVLPAGRRHPR